MDMQKERAKFESLPDIAERLHVATYSESLGFYHAAVLNSGHDVAYVNGAWKAWQAAKASAVPDGFILVPKSDVYDHYIANHLKGTTCSVDVSELTGNDGDRIYGKLREYDCLGSDGNTLIYDLESSNFKLVKSAGNTGDYVLVPKELTAKQNREGVKKFVKHRNNNTWACDAIDDIYKAMIEAAHEQDQ